MFTKSEQPFFVLNRYRQSLNISIDIDSDNIAENLEALARKHFQKYAFHSLHFNLKDTNNSENQDMRIVMNKNALIDQLIKDCGGSCYHHNAVFQMILEKNGIESWFISCLVHNPMKPEETFKMATHVAIVFNCKNVSYLFDPGWNGTSFAIYPLPSSSGDVIKINNHQVRKTDNPEFPFVFEEIRPNGLIVPRYDFSDRQTQLEDFCKAIHYLHSKDYAFHTLFLFSRIHAEQQIIRFVNRRLIIQDMNGKETHNKELSDDTSITQKLTELFGEHEGLMEILNNTDFKNPDLGDLVCQATNEASLANCL